MRTRLLSCTVLAALWVVAGASCVWAQRVEELRSQTALWHEARRLRNALEADPAQPAAILRLAALELSIGRPEKAGDLLSRDWGQSWPQEIVSPLRGEAEYQMGRFEVAADLFARAAVELEGRRRGIMLVRSAEAYERAGAHENAAARYRVAASEVPELADWLGVREARLTVNTGRALDLLARAPAAASEVGHRARAAVLLSAGDSAAAVDALVDAGLESAAATLALTLSDSATSRVLTYQSLASQDTAALQVGLALATTAFPPRTALEYFSIARAHHRMGSTAAALESARIGATIDTSSADLLVYWAELLELTGKRSDALAVYYRAASQSGEAAQMAAFKRGRLLVRMRRTREAIASLTAFADSFPQHPSASVALYLVADGHRRLGHGSGVDSVYGVISERWPRSYYASRSRLNLARRALERGDTIQAVGWYSAEVELGARERFAAQYEIASLTADSLERRGLLALLARADSIGYYGTIARRAARLPPLDIAGAPAPPPSRLVSQTLAVLDLLLEAHLFEEVDALINHIMADQPRPPVQLLDYAEGLIQRGFMSEGIQLGWRATRAYTLNHPRVLRAIFPWPMRKLIEDEAERQGLDPYLLAALIRQESAFRPQVVSRAGAYGLMQLMPATARQLAQRLGIRWDRRLLTVADANLHLGAVHFANLLERYGGAVEPALAAYNAGGTPVRRWLRNPGSDDAVRFVAQVSYPETQGYLRTVTRNHALYQALYPPQEVTVNGTP
ncbi:MAG: transglycosylase SLT domain-containing protein [Gemmatimonadota bacterium]|nr:MAG: transglycosylase SLT domain-containing protein [Gemmatimonadota bacterium]